MHDFRATMKLWRAFLRLIEPHLEEEPYPRKNRSAKSHKLNIRAPNGQTAFDA